MKKLIITASATFILGVLAASLVLWPQINNRYVIGHNAGKLDGGFEVVNFLKKNVQNSDMERAIELNKSLGVKYVSISVVEINGVKTVVVKE